MIAENNHIIDLKGIGDGNIYLFISGFSVKKIASCENIHYISVEWIVIVYPDSI